MTRVLPALVALVLLALPCAAVAQQGPTNAPPGNSAIDEYLETVPSATGNQRPRAPGSGNEESSVLTAKQRARLEQLGPDGKALVAAIDATAPPPAKPGQKLDLDSGEGRSPIGAVLDAATGSDGGMGIFLPLILLASLLGTIVLVVLRRRSAS